jgi:carboxymethylenebutenolidase
MNASITSPFFLHKLHLVPSQSFTSVPKFPSISFNVDFIWLLTFHAVTGPVARFARQIASQGYIVAAPSSYHEFTGPEALAYDGPGTDKGNEWKITKKVEAYDEDAKLSVDALLDLPTCNGRIGATGKSHETQLTLVRD